MQTIWTKEQIVDLLKKNNRAVERGVLVLYEKQTFSEQATSQTKEHNNVGFNAYDAPFLTSLAEQITKQRSLSQKQIEIARKMIIKYAGQLAKIANKEI